MIRNEQQLTIVRRQLALIEEALESLRREVLPKNKKNFEVLSEGYVDQIAALREDIEAYTGVAGSAAVGQTSANGPLRGPAPSPDPAER
jgi:hypothetical protein